MMKVRLIAILTAVISVMPLALADAGDLPALVQVGGVCGISAFDPTGLNFGIIAPGATSPEKSVAVTYTNDAEGAIMNIQGTEWTSEPNTMPVGQTTWRWDMLASFTGLTSTATDIELALETDGENIQPFQFKLSVPDGQPGGAYAQVITYTIDC
ncbi:hypothetical protein A3K63_03475 [Candidatus Micrarchaeota archaeon RBG_16_49_10]|nr:MAG: hypothetical protein A3K63_03475 [Candidatus Micrarchaeota archaeon RBG_16_49_10]